MADEVKAPAPAAPAAAAPAKTETTYTVALKIKNKELFELGPSGWKSTKDGHNEVLTASPKQTQFFKDWAAATAAGWKK